MGNKSGIFLTLEGGEGAGKSTSLGFVEETLTAAGCDVRVTREPGGTRLGEKLREIMLHSSDLGICDSAELLMMFAARAQHLHEVIEPALAQGQIVICDRFTDASYAYQGGGRGIDDTRIAALENWVQGSRRPDITLLFDLPIEQGRERAGQRSAPDRFEQEQNEFFKRVRDKYLELAEKEPNRITVIDASQDIEGVRAQLQPVLQQVIKRHGR